jgi:hypothetical protein
MQISTDNLVTVVAAAVTVFGTIGGVVIANRLSYVRSGKEKLWDLRRVAYSKILSELGSIEQICNAADEYVSELGQDGYWNDKVRIRHDNKIAQHKKTIENWFSEDYLIFSDKFIAAYNAYIHDMRSDPHNTLPDDSRDILADAVREHRPLLLELARSEMDIKF